MFRAYSSENTTKMYLTATSSGKKPSHSYLSHLLGGAKKGRCLPRNGEENEIHIFLKCKEARR
jgi:hypothetical protein